MVYSDYVVCLLFLLFGLDVVTIAKCKVILACLLSPAYCEDGPEPKQTL